MHTGKLTLQNYSQPNATTNTGIKPKGKWQMQQHLTRFLGQIDNIKVNYLRYSGRYYFLIGRSTRALAAT